MSLLQLRINTSDLEKLCLGDAQIITLNYVTELRGGCIQNKQKAITKEKCNKNTMNTMYEQSTKKGKEKGDTII